MAKISWKQLTYNIAQACRDALGNNEIIKVKDLPDTIRGLGSLSSSTVEPKEVTYGEVTYNEQGRLIGSAPFTYEGYINTVDGDTNYKVLTKSVSDKKADITSWSQTTMPASGSWIIAYGDGKVVAIDGNQSKNAVYSEDGINWMQTELPVSQDWSYVTYGDGKFVAVANYSSMTNIAAYSEDGINWVQTELPVSSYWVSVAYGDGKFVTIDAHYHKAAYSEDGINWTETTLPTSATWQSVAYGDGKFVAISSANSNIAAYSEDGITWIQTTLPVNNSWTSVTYGNGKFVAVAECFRMNPTNIAAYSEDGITWTQTTMPLSDEWVSVAYGDGKFVAISWNGVLAYSVDGINWLQAETTFPAAYNIIYGNNRFIIVLDESLAYSGYTEISNSKIKEEILLSATGCTNRTLSIVDNELVLNNMIIDENAIL